MTKSSNASLATYVIAIFVACRADAQDEKPSPLPPVAAPRQCGCELMTLKTHGTSPLVDIGRNPANPDEKGPLGADLVYVTMNFGIEATLKGNDPELCTEGQEAKATDTIDGITKDKKSCTAGQIHLGLCQSDTDCNTSFCSGGVRDGDPIDSFASLQQCRLGGGTASQNSDGKCGSFPFNGQPRGDDGYAKPWVPNDPWAHSPKVVSTKNHKITWFDAVGLQNSKKNETTKNIDVEAEFRAFVTGSLGSCSCHFKMKFGFDGAQHTFKPGAKITKIDNPEAPSFVNCVQD